MVVTANLGFPRLGADRALKFALERHWRLQADRGIERVPVGDFSL